MSIAPKDVEGRERELDKYHRLYRVIEDIDGHVIFLLTINELILLYHASFISSIRMTHHLNGGPSLKKQNKAVDFSTALSDVMDFESASSATVPSSHYNIKSPTLGKAVLCMVAGHLRVQNGY